MAHCGADPLSADGRPTARGDGRSLWRRSIGVRSPRRGYAPIAGAAGGTPSGSRDERGPPLSRFGPKLGRMVTGNVANINQSYSTGLYAGHKKQQKPTITNWLFEILLKILSVLVIGFFSRAPWSEEVVFPVILTENQVFYSFCQ